MEVPMFLYRFLFSRTPALIGLVVVGLMCQARPAAAQQPLGTVSKFDRANAGAALAGYAPWYAQPGRSQGHRRYCRALPQALWW